MHISYADFDRILSLFLLCLTTISPLLTLLRIDFLIFRRDNPRKQDCRAILVRTMLPRLHKQRRFILFNNKDLGQLKDKRLGEVKYFFVSRGCVIEELAGL